MRILTKINNTDFVKAYVLIAYFIVIGILALYAFSPFSGEMGYILGRLTPHLIYIPLVLTALWYPQKKFAHILIFLLILILFVAGYLREGWSSDLIFTIFTSFIYLWVYFAILLIPSWDSREGRKKAVSDDFPGKDTAFSGRTAVIHDGSLAAERDFTTQKEPAKPCTTPLPEYRSVPSEQILPLIESFKIRDSDVLSNTFRAIEAVGSPAEPYLVNELKNPDLSIRENSARMLGILKSSDSICSLIEAMDDNSNKMHNAAVSALANIGEPAVAPLMKSLSDAKPNIRAGSAAALRVIGVKGAIPNIVPLLSDESHYVRKEAAKSLGRLGDESVADELCKVINDESRGVRLAAVAALGRVKNKASVPYLFEQLKAENDCQVRERIVESLGQIGGEAAIVAIKYATLDSDPEIRILAKEYLFGYNYLIN
ncbi:MAG: HEAT repeat domain-containing protein [Methanomicrobiaceae archaeon]|nr:HEAT repeat domain-containing protein [Methanomicrobiaceae archaeon]